MNDGLILPCMWASWMSFSELQELDRLQPASRLCEQPNDEDQAVTNIWHFYTFLNIFFLFCETVVLKSIWILK